jgi:hypothetical protein
MRWLLLLFFGAIGTGLLYIAGMQGIERYPLWRDRVEARGTIMEIKEERSAGGSEIVYFPVVEFSANGNAKMRFRAEAGSANASSYEVGTEVDVLYDPRDPMHARIGSVSQLWTGPMATGGIGLAVMLLSALLFVRIGRFEKNLASLVSGNKEV